MLRAVRAMSLDGSVSAGHFIEDDLYAKNTAVESIVRVALRVDLRSGVL
jgi:hypothetical protein